MATRTLKLLGLLLTYPSIPLVEASDEILKLLEEEQWLPKRSLEGMKHLIQHMKSTDIFDLQEEYVLLFDRTPSLSLHLFEHIHGDSRERGPAMVDLDTVYREAGLKNSSDETPDYLPLFLEYLSILPAEQAQEDLKGAIDVIAVIGERLKKRESLYSKIFEGLVMASKHMPDAAKLKCAIAADAGNIPDIETLDQVWEEQFAFENPSSQSSGCPKAEEMLARISTSNIKMEKQS